MIWVTGDWHLWHENVCSLCNRPFSDVEAMNVKFQERINERVGAKDRLIVLGDLAFGPWERLAGWLDGLECKDLWVAWGNHDHTAERLYKNQPKYFNKVGDILEIKWEGKLIIACHYAMRTWRNSCHGSFHIYGHSHGGLSDAGNRSADVGVDTGIHYAPYEITDVLERLESRPFNPHH